MIDIKTYFEKTAYSGEYDDSGDGNDDTVKWRISQRLESGLR